jgi:diacylglycerol kinase (ATP)
LKLVAVVNPAAGGGRAASIWEELRHRDRRLDGAAVVCAAGVEKTHDELGVLLDGGADRVIVVGGDGSLHLVGNLILERGLGRTVSLGLVPVGTGSDLARTLGIPKDRSAALDRVLEAEPRSVDALQLTTDDGRRCFVLNVASAGISGPVDEAVNAIPGRGQAAYLMATLGALRRYRPAPCRVVVDGELWHEGGILLVAVANGTSFGRGMKVAPRASIDDGAADVVLVPPVAPWQLLFRLPQIYLGTHLDSSLVRWGRCRSVRLEPMGDDFPPFDLDGEVFPSSAAEITVLPKALRFLV